MIASSSSSKRRRGAPPGHQNARKRRFYAAQNPASAQAEGNSLSIDLQAEIDFIHQSMPRVIAFGELGTYRGAVDSLRALSLAATDLTRLVRTNRYINPAFDPRHELTRHIQQALKEVYAKIEAGEMLQVWLICYLSIAIPHFNNRTLCHNRIGFPLPKGVGGIRNPAIQY